MSHQVVFMIVHFYVCNNDCLKEVVNLGKNRMGMDVGEVQKEERDGEIFAINLLFAIILFN